MEAARQVYSDRYQELGDDVELPENKLTENFFVYGTLRSGHYNHEPMMRSIVCLYQQDAKIRGEVKPTRYGFPCLLEGLGLVEGELYATDKEGLKWLDFFEGTPALYERRKVALVDKEGNETGMSAWVFYGTGAKNAIIKEG